MFDTSPEALTYDEYLITPQEEVKKGVLILNKDGVQATTE
jgi:hypothetical protein